MQGKILSLKNSSVHALCACVCVHMSVYVCTYKYMCVHMNIHVYMYVLACMRVYVYVCGGVYVCMRAYVYAYVCLCVYLSVCL